MPTRLVSAAALLLALLFAPFAAFAQCPPTVPVQGPPIQFQVFPTDNWWNVDISAAPVDSNSANFINFIGPTRGLHPDFGGTAGGNDIYGIPYAVVDGSQPKKAVDFEYWDESDGVDMSTGEGIPFYPIPAQAITQPHWIEGGEPGSVDQRGETDRHLLMIDCTNRHLYELYHVWYSTAQQKWYAVSGAFFDMDTNNRRPDGWTSADASGLAIFPGLVRYDEAGDPNVPEIRHALRLTVRSVNGYVYPASHNAGNTAGALPLGARLRLKTNVNGSDPAMRTSDPIARKIFRAMQKYGLIVIDNGSDMYVTGTFDVRWNNGVLNPAFNQIKASDFEVIQRGWRPTSNPAALNAVSASPNPVTGGQNSTGQVTLTAGAPSGGANVALSRGSSTVFNVPSSVTVPSGATSATFNITTTVPASQTTGTLTATYAGVTRTTAITVNPPPAALSAVSASPNPVIGGQASTGQVTLTAAAPTGGAVVVLTRVGSAFDIPGSVTVPAGATSATFPISTTPPATTTTGTITASYNGVDRSTSFTVNPVPAALASLGTNPGTVTGGDPSTGLVTLTTGAPPGGATIALSRTGSTAFTVPASVTVPQGATTATFNIPTTPPASQSTGTISATYAGVTRTATLTVNPLPPPTLSIEDGARVEGNSGQAPISFTVRLSRAIASPVTYSVSTANGSGRYKTYSAAQAGSDYVARALTGQSIAPGQTTATFQVQVNGDTTAENREYFVVDLAVQSGAVLGDGRAIGVIVDDDPGIQAGTGMQRGNVPPVQPGPARPRGNP